MLFFRDHDLNGLLRCPAQKDRIAFYLPAREFRSESAAAMRPYAPDLNLAIEYVVESNFIHVRRLTGTRNGDFVGVFPRGDCSYGFCRSGVGDILVTECAFRDNICFREAGLHISPDHAFQTVGAVNDRASRDYVVGELVPDKRCPRSQRGVYVEYGRQHFILYINEIES